LEEGEGGAENLLDSTNKISKEDFEFMKVVGRGSFGKVYMVKKKDSPLDIYAIKVLDKSVLKKRNLLIKT
jgi:serine/threonine protein kinase